MPVFRDSKGRFVSTRNLVKYFPSSDDEDDTRCTYRKITGEKVRREESVDSCDSSSCDSSSCDSSSCDSSSCDSSSSWQQSSTESDSDEDVSLCSSSSFEPESDSDSEVSVHSIRFHPAKAHRVPCVIMPCRYGINCYRKAHYHFAEFSHPREHPRYDIHYDCRGNPLNTPNEPLDDTSSNAGSEDSGDAFVLTPCRYGVDCYRLEHSHFSNFSHPRGHPRYLIHHYDTGILRPLPTVVTPCRYGADCYRKENSHFVDFSHPSDHLQYSIYYDRKGNPRCPKDDQNCHDEDCIVHYESVTSSDHETVSTITGGDDDKLSSQQVFALIQRVFPDYNPKNDFETCGYAIELGNKTLLWRAIDEGCMVSYDCVNTAICMPVFFDEDIERLIYVANNPRKIDIHLLAEKGYIRSINAVLPKLKSYSLAVQNERGYTALMYAAEHGHFAVVKSLLEKMTPYCIALRNKDMKTASILARDNGHTTLARDIAAEWKRRSWTETK